MHELKGFLCPVKIRDKEGPGWDMRDVFISVYQLVATDENHFTQRAKIMTDAAERAENLITKYTEAMADSINKMTQKEEEAAAAAKKVAGSLKDSFEKLSQGLSRIEKTANFDRLERYVDLLERADKAISSLAEIEKSGRLEKIAAAIR